MHVHVLYFHCLCSSDVENPNSILSIICFLYRVEISIRFTTIFYTNYWFKLAICGWKEHFFFLWCILTDTMCYVYSKKLKHVLQRLLIFLYFALKATKPLWLLWYLACENTSLTWIWNTGYRALFFLFFYSVFWNRYHACYWYKNNTTTTTTTDGCCVNKCTCNHFRC